MGIQPFSTEWVDLARVRLTREAREKLIVEGAIRFFAEVGFNGQTRELAKQLGMSQPLLFKYFPTKEDLINRVYKEVYLARWSPYWETVLENRKLPLYERLLRFYSEYTRNIMHVEWIRIFLHASLLGNEINARYLELLQSRVVNRICHALREEAGLPKIEDAQLSRRELQLVWSLQGSILYLAIQTHVYRNYGGGDIDQVIKDRVAAFLYGSLSVLRSMKMAAE